MKIKVIEEKNTKKGPSVNIDDSDDDEEEEEDDEG